MHLRVKVRHLPFWVKAFLTDSSLSPLVGTVGTLLELGGTCRNSRILSELGGTCRNFVKLVGAWWNLSEPVGTLLSQSERLGCDHFFFTFPWPPRIAFASTLTYHVGHYLQHPPQPGPFLARTCRNLPELLLRRRAQQ